MKQKNIDLTLGNRWGEFKTVNTITITHFYDSFVIASRWGSAMAAIDVFSTQGNEAKRH